MSFLRQRKIALLSLSISLLIIASCRAKNDLPVNESAPSEIVVSSTPPFQTKEPDRYRASRTITIVTPEGKTVVTESSIARDGEMRRNETETASKKVAYLDIPEGKFVLLPGEKVYADLASETESPTADDEISPDSFLHSEATQTSYQQLGTELIAGRNTNKYRILVKSSSPGSVSQSETLIWIDETLRIPIRSETTSPDGTKITMELSDVLLNVDSSMFQVPEDYEKVAFSEFRKRLIKTD